MRVSGLHGGVYRSPQGAATVFTGCLRAGAFVGIQMVTIGQDGFPELQLAAVLAAS